jgi:hypothetical protein
VYIEKRGMFLNEIPSQSGSMILLHYPIMQLDHLSSLIGRKHFSIVIFHHSMRLGSTDRLFGKPNEYFAIPPKEILFFFGINLGQMVVKIFEPKVFDIWRKLSKRFAPVSLSPVLCCIAPHPTFVNIELIVCIESISCHFYPLIVKIELHSLN